MGFYEEFADPTGQFVGYDTYDAAQRAALAGQRHVDIRSFQGPPFPTPYTMQTLDLLGSGPPTDGMQLVDALSVQQLDGAPVPDETWSAGTVTPQADRNNFPGLTLTCIIGTTTTQSIQAPVSLVPFGPTDYISVALPAFPLASLNTAGTVIDISSDSSGAFAAAQTDSLIFTQSTAVLLAGDCEARFPLSLLQNADPSSISAIRFRIQATVGCTFRCLAIRCLASTWRYAPLDQNTAYGLLGATVPPSGGLSQPYSFPTATAPVTPADWPVMFFGGPEIVDAEIGVIIRTGANLAGNAFTLYLRELPMITNTMAMLDAETLQTIEALGQQPDYTPGTTDVFAQSHYRTVTLNWGTTTGLHFASYSGTTFDFTNFTMAPNSSYYLLVTLQDQSLQARLYPVTASGVQWATPTYDTTALIDSAFVARHRGRFGWYADLNEGGTFLQALRPRRLVYSEYRSAPLLSMTPVDGAQLFTSATPDRELFTGLVSYHGADVTADVTKSTSGRCARVTCLGQVPLEGAITDAARFENLYDTVIEFDLLAPAGLVFDVLLTGDSTILLWMPPYAPDQWTSITIPLEWIAAQSLPGIYSLVLLQTEVQQTTWWVDNLSIRTRSVAWYGRGQGQDPRGMINAPWIPFGDTVNDPVSGALLGRGRSLQVRGQALTTDAEMTSLTIRPKYSHLGDFVWPDQAPTYPAAPVASFSVSQLGGVPHGVSCNAGASTAAGGINSYAWSFGDGGAAYGVTATHAYMSPGTYTVGLILTDHYGQQTGATSTVTVAW